MKHLFDVLPAPRDADAHALQDSTRTLTRDALLQRVQMLATTLRALHVRRVALHADNGIGWVLTDLACQHASLVCVPLPLFFTKQQWLHTVNACGIDALVTSSPEQFAAHFPTAAPEHQRLREYGLTLLVQPAARDPLLPAGTGKVTFTSGSTGAPKGVCLTTGQQLAQAMALAHAVAIDAPRHLCLLPLATLLENVAGVYAPLLADGSVVLRSLVELGYAGSRLADPRKFLAAIDAAAPDTLILIPQMLQFLVQAVQKGWKPPPLQFIAVGGARVSAQLIVEARRAGLPVYEGYGLSECASVVSLNTPRADRPGSAGKPLPHLSVTLDDGEILVSGNAMLGYVGEARSWYRKRIATGDLGYLDSDGFLHISGRSKNLLISSYGRNIAPEWVESELLAAPAVAEAVVLGDARPYCIALLTPASPQLDDAVLAAAVAAANARLPDYAHVKRWIRLSRPLAGQAEFMTPAGKPRRDRIEQAWHADVAALYAQTETEENL
ncbi:MAG TPA: AMP-binding protein [Pseudomonadales bacterium]